MTISWALESKMTVSDNKQILLNGKYNLEIHSHGYDL